MTDKKMSPLQMRMEAAKEAIERSLSAAGLKPRINPKSELNQESVLNPKPVLDPKPALDPRSTLDPKSAPDSKSAGNPKLVHDATAIKEEVAPAVSLDGLPDGSDLGTAGRRTNPCAGLKASRKRKHSDTPPPSIIKEEITATVSLNSLPQASDLRPTTLPSNPFGGLKASRKRKYSDIPINKAREELFLSEGEDNEAHSDHPSTFIKDIKKEEFPHRQQLSLADTVTGPSTRQQLSLADTVTESPTSQQAFFPDTIAEASTRQQTSLEDTIAESSTAQQVSLGDTIAESTNGKKKAQPRPFAPAKRASNKKAATKLTMQTVNTRTTTNSGDWYDTINMRQHYNRADLETLKYVVTLIKNCEEAVLTGEDLQILFLRLRKRIHDMGFYAFLTGVLVRKSKVLEDNGLEAIIDNQALHYPWDIRADALALYRKWRTGVIDPHLLRGIDTKQGTAKNGRKCVSRSLDPTFIGRKSCNYTGEGNLVNGQWWPLQICAMRDGAHGELEAGIHGQPGQWAYSIVLSGGGYSNVDEGNLVKYCGTSGTGGEPTAGTKLMKKSFEERREIRVLRSASLGPNNAYRPSKGLRYDGVYKISDYEVVDADTAMHRFTLRRRQNQDLIRCSGVEKRPTDEELSEYSKIRGLVGLTN